MIHRECVAGAGLLHNINQRVDRFFCPPPYLDPRFREASAPDPYSAAWADALRALEAFKPETAA